MKAIAVFGFVFLTAFGASAEIRSLTPAHRGVTETSWWYKRHIEKCAIATNEQPKVVFIGDSITHFWEGAGWNTWCRYFQKGPRKAVNLGFSADRTEHVIWRLQHGELDGYEAKCVLLMIGTNNTGHHSVYEETPIDTIEGVKRILDIIAEKQPKARTILTAIFPCGPGTGGEGRRRNYVVNRELAKFADGRKVVWCDFTDKFLMADGTLSTDFFPDHLHPGPEGYEVWASAVVPLVDRILAGDPDDPIPSVWPSCPRGHLDCVGVENSTRSAYRSMIHVGKWHWRNGILARQRAQMTAATNAFDLVVVGDSPTNRFLTAAGNVLDLAIEGDSTANVLWRLTYGELDGYKAKAFVVDVGTNNCSWDRSVNTVDGTRMIVELIRKKHPGATVSLMPVRGKDADKLNAGIKALADGKDVLWLGPGDDATAAAK